MSISPSTQSILLLTAHFSKAKDGDPKPLTPTEWGRFATWLKDESLTPDALMTGDLDDSLRGWSDKSVTLGRLRVLLDRGSALALAVEKWLRVGLWVLTRSDADYPSRLKRHLGQQSPAVLFGCGNRSLLDGGGLAVVGSRNTSKSDLAYSQSVGQAAAQSGFSIISGGARGVDETAMLGALEVEGTVVGVLANNLLRASSSQTYRPHLLANNLVLVSPFYPEAAFNVGNAMQRNKYIYCLADAAMVVHSGNKGGTWNGAFENLKKRWVPLWVKQTNDSKAGNAAIVDAGGRWVSADVQAVDVRCLLGSEAESTGQAPTNAGHETIDTTVDQPSDSLGESVGAPDCEPEVGSITGATHTMSLYDCFLTLVKPLCQESPKTADDLVKNLESHKTQTNIWLKRAVEDELLTKLTNPVRYQWTTSQQRSLLPNE